MIDMSEQIYKREYYELNQNLKLPDETPQVSVDRKDG